MNLNLNVIKFLQQYDNDPELRAKVEQAEMMYPGSLEIRESVVEDVLIPIAEEMGLGFTLMDLYNYERQLKRERSRDVALTEEELKAADEEYHYWLVDKGWENDESCFKQDSRLPMRKKTDGQKDRLFSLVLQRGFEPRLLARCARKALI